MLLTFDDDFLSLVEREEMEHSGIAYVNQSSRRIGEVVKQVDKHLQNADDPECDVVWSSSGLERAFIDFCAKPVCE